MPASQSPAEPTAGNTAQDSDAADKDELNETLDQILGSLMIWIPCIPSSTTSRIPI
jgi:hypothetical protein